MQSFNIYNYTILVSRSAFFLSRIIYCICISYYAYSVLFLNVPGTIVLFLKVQAFVAHSAVFACFLSYMYVVSLHKYKAHTYCLYCFIWCTCSPVFFMYSSTSSMYIHTYEEVLVHNIRENTTPALE